MKNDTHTMNVIALVYHCMDRVTFLHVHRHSGWLIYETCIDRDSLHSLVCKKTENEKDSRDDQKESGATGMDH